MYFFFFKIEPVTHNRFIEQPTRHTIMQIFKFYAVCHINIQFIHTILT